MSGRYRILLCSPAGITRKTGVGMALHHHVRGFLKRGHAVEFVSTPDQMPAFIDDYPGLKLKSFELKDSGRYGWRYRGEHAAFQDYVAGFDGDFIISHMMAGWTTDLLAHAPRRTAAKRIAVGHGYHMMPYRPVLRKYCLGLYNWLSYRLNMVTLHRMLRRFDHLVFLANQEGNRRNYHDLWVASQHRLPYSVIPNGAEVARPAMSRDELMSRMNMDPRPYVLNVAEYSDIKNQIEGLCIFLDADSRDHNMVFIGSSSNKYMRRLQMLLEANKHRLGGRKVYILSSVDRSVTEAFLGYADLFLLSSKFDAQPIVLLESMSVGVPFVSTDVGCVREFDGGIVADNHGGLVAAVNRLLKDHSLRERLVAKARIQISAKYNWDSISDQYEALFDALSGKDTPR